MTIKETITGKAGGWGAAGVATLIGALATAWVTVVGPDEEGKAAIAEVQRLKIQMSEQGAHESQKAVGSLVTGTSAGVVQLLLYDLGCIKVVWPGKVTYVRSRIHEVETADVRSERAVQELAAGAMGAARYVGVNCGDPRWHEGWDGQVMVSEHPDPEGFYAFDLLWYHGTRDVQCAQRARRHPDGRTYRGEWIRCAH